MTRDDKVIDWLLDPEQSDPSIRWQVMRDLLDVPESDWRAERARVETEGWGARLLAAQDEDGQWAGGAHFPADYVWGGDEPGQPWTSTSHSLAQLREFGFDPTPDRARRMVELIGANARWEHDNQPYWEGEVEPCVNGALVANGTYLGVDMTPVVERLVGERLEDGGWNCEAERGSVRSSFDSTINVLEGLLEFERVTGGTPESRGARRSGEEYLLVRSLFRRLSTGETGRRAIPLLPPPQSLALRRAPCPRLLSFGFAPDRSRPRYEACRGRRARSFTTVGRRHLAPRLEPGRTHLVRRGRRTGPALALDHPAGVAGSPLVGQPPVNRCDHW